MINNWHSNALIRFSIEIFAFFWVFDNKTKVKYYFISTELKNEKFTKNGNILLTKLIPTSEEDYVPDSLWQLYDEDEFYVIGELGTQVWDWWLGTRYKLTWKTWITTKNKNHNIIDLLLVLVHNRLVIVTILLCVFEMAKDHVRENIMWWGSHGSITCITNLIYKWLYYELIILLIIIGIQFIDF